MGPKIINNEAPGRSEEVLGSTRFQERNEATATQVKWNRLGATLSMLGFNSDPIGILMAYPLCICQGFQRIRKNYNKYSLPLYR